MKQLTVSLENRPGTLAHVAKVLADVKVNVLAVLGSTAGAQDSVQVVVDNANKAKKALGGAGLSLTEGTLVEFELTNKPGALAQLAEKLAKKGINIELPTLRCTRARRRQSGCWELPSRGRRAGVGCRPYSGGIDEQNRVGTMKHLTKLEKAVSAWLRVSVRPHRFGGREFRFGSAEIGHVHTGGIVDIPFPLSIRDALLEEGLAEEHQWAPDSGWVTFRVGHEEDLQHALWLMRLSYLRYALKTDADPRRLLEQESAGLYLSTHFRSLLERLVPANRTSAEPHPT